MGIANRGFSTDQVLILEISPAQHQERLLRQGVPRARAAFPRPRPGSRPGSPPCRRARADADEQPAHGDLAIAARSRLGADQAVAATSSASAQSARPRPGSVAASVMSVLWSGQRSCSATCAAQARGPLE